MTRKEKKKKEKQKLKELWGKVKFTVEPKRTTVIENKKIITYKGSEAK